MPGDESVGGTDNALAFSPTDGIFRRVDVLAGFDFNKGEDIAVPCDHVDFAVPSAIVHSCDPVSMRSEVIRRGDLGTAAERQETVK